jgi:triosephosphate isomerase
LTIQPTNSGDDVRKKLVAGNWKMNGTLAANRLLLGSLSAVPGIDVAVCVPYPYLAQAQAMLDGNGIALGAQDVSEYVEGPYTGEVSAAMLHDFGCVYTIVGHSERRALFAEDDLQVGRKATAALAVGLVPIVCVGETLAERDEGRVMAVIGRQLGAVLEVLGAAALGSTVIAYEPVWAIGSGRPATVEQIAEVHVAIRGWLRGHGVSADGVRILYGGSVKPDNARELFAAAGVDGGLVGGASLVADDFLAICRGAVLAQF